MAKRKLKSARRRIRGRDWHGWALKLAGEKGPAALCHWAEPGNKPKSEGDNKWVRVKFVELK